MQHANQAEGPDMGCRAPQCSSPTPLLARFPIQMVRCNLNKSVRSCTLNAYTSAKHLSPLGCSVVPRSRLVEARGLRIRWFGVGHGCRRKERTGFPAPSGIA